MTKKRFIGSCAGFYDKYKKNRWLWSEWEEITTILNNLNEKSVERSKALSKLQKENEQLKSTNMEMEDYLGRLEEVNINLQIKLQKIRDYAKEDGEVKQGIIEKVILNDLYS